MEPRENIERNRSSLDRWMEGATWLDGPAETLQNWILKLYELAGAPGRSVKDLLHGTRPLGHPLHPAVTDVPIGAFTVMFLADWLALLTRAIPSQIGPFCLIIGILGAFTGILLGFSLSYTLSRVPFPANENIYLKYFPVIFDLKYYAFGMFFGVITTFVCP